MNAPVTTLIGRSTRSGVTSPGNSMLPADRVFPPEWCAVRDALKAGYKPPLLDPVPPPPLSVGLGQLTETEKGTVVVPHRQWDAGGHDELEVVRRCVGGPLKGAAILLAHGDAWEGDD